MTIKDKPTDEEALIQQEELEELEESEEFDDDSEDFDDSMDGDHESALASAGWGTDEDYGSYDDDGGDW